MSQSTLCVVGCVSITQTLLAH